jgi:hypothetical protein
MSMVEEVGPKWPKIDQFWKNFLSTTAHRKEKNEYVVM